MEHIKKNYSKTKVFHDKKEGNLIFCKDPKLAFEISILTRLIHGKEITGQIVLQEVAFSYNEGITDMN